MLCTHRDPIVFTFMEIHKIRSLVSKNVFFETSDLILCISRMYTQFARHTFEKNDLIFMYSMNVNTVGSLCVHSIL